VDRGEVVPAAVGTFHLECLDQAGGIQAEGLGVDDESQVLVGRDVGLVHLLERDTGNSCTGALEGGRELVPVCDPLVEALQGGQCNSGVQLGHPGVEPREAAVVVAGVAIVPAEADRLGERGIVRGDQPPFTGHDDLGGAQAEHLGRAEAADRPTAPPTPEGVRGVVDER
jgi:hypothetical protein